MECLYSAILNQPFHMYFKDETNVIAIKIFIINIIIVSTSIKIIKERYILVLWAMYIQLYTYVTLINKIRKVYTRSKVTLIRNPLDRRSTSTLFDTCLLDDVILRLWHHKQPIKDEYLLVFPSCNVDVQSNFRTRLLEQICGNLVSLKEFN